MPQLPEPLERLIQELSRLPGIGPKTAQRLAFHLLRSDRQRADSLSQLKHDVNDRFGRWKIRSGATLFANDFYSDPANEHDICDVRGKFCF